MMIYPPLWSSCVESAVREAAHAMDTQKVAPGNPIMCRRCVMTNKRPRIVFDDAGICSACRWAEAKKTINWGKRLSLLNDLMVEHHKEIGHDVIVPASGGKDSSYVALQLRKNGMTPLLARWAPCIPTEIGERNWQALLHAGFTGVTAQPNGLVHRKLARLGMEFYGDPFLPFIFGQLAWPFHVADQNDVALVFFGENGEAEYGGDPAANHKPCWDEADWDRVYMKTASVEKLFSIGLELGCFSRQEIWNNHKFYEIPRQFHDVRPQFHWWSYYENWKPQRNYYSAMDEAGFKPRTDRSTGTHSCYASLDDGLDDLHYYFGYLKFGIGRCTSDCAHEIRDGELDRDDALKMVSLYDGEVPTRGEEKWLSYLGVGQGYMESVYERFRSPWAKRR